MMTGWSPAYQVTEKRIRPCAGLSHPLLQCPTYALLGVGGLCME